MRILAIDIETYSSNDLLGSGVYKYTDAVDFDILLFAYAFDDEPVRIIEKGEPLPKEVLSALTDSTIIKTAFNAAFERVCISRFYGIHLPIEQWRCTMVQAATLGFPLSLAQVGKIMKLEEGKMDEGKALIRFFSLPCKPTKTNGGRTRNLPEHDVEKWVLFKQYCIRDVEVERSIRHRLNAMRAIPESEHNLYRIDQEICDRGVLLDMRFVNNAIDMDKEYKKVLEEEAIRLTGLDNPNSAAQLKTWVSAQTGEVVDSMTKATVLDLVATTDGSVQRMMEIRQEMAKTSTKKYDAMQEAVCSDGRVRGLLQYYGASRTGRWAGRLVQVQNLPQNHLNDLDLARDTVLSGDLDMLQMLYGNVPDTLSQLIRTAFVAPKGYTFYVADFSAIEARVIAWLADEAWRLDVFATHGKIYEASAAQMFHVPIESIGKHSPLRQKGKVSELALGYQGGVGALTAMGALKMGVEEHELQGLVNAWRQANPAIVRLWAEVQKAAVKAINENTLVPIKHGVSIDCRGSVMYINLPSGRFLTYLQPRIGENQFGNRSIQYEGMNQTTKQWQTTDAYGGKLVENIIQAIARDCLAETLVRLEKNKFPVVFHVHDEAIIEMSKHDSRTLDEVCELMGQPIDWAPGLPLRADGYTTDYYKKD